MQQEWIPWPTCRSPGKFFVTMISVVNRAVIQAQISSDFFEGQTTLSVPDDYAYVSVTQAFFSFVRALQGLILVCFVRLLGFDRPQEHVRHFFSPSSAEQIPAAALQIFARTSAPTSPSDECTGADYAKPILQHEAFFLAPIAFLVHRSSSIPNSTYWSRLNGSHSSRSVQSKPIAKACSFLAIPYSMASSLSVYTP